jgi:hypothetical protein
MYALVIFDRSSQLYVRFAPKTNEMRIAAKRRCVPSASLDHLVGAGEQRRRNGKAERSRRLQVYDEFELGRL